MRPPRPKPCCRRQSWRFRYSNEIGIPAGKPLSVATRHSPCDSPAVSKRSIPIFYGNVTTETHARSVKAPFDASPNLCRWIRQGPSKYRQSEIATCWRAFQQHGIIGQAEDSLPGLHVNHTNQVESLVRT